MLLLPNRPRLDCRVSGLVFLDADIAPYPKSYIDEDDTNNETAPYVAVVEKDRFAHPYDFKSVYGNNNFSSQIKVRF